MGANWVHIFSPSIVNSARLGFTRTIWNEGLPQDPTGQFGTGGNAKVGITFQNQLQEGFTYQGLENNLTGVGAPGALEPLRVRLPREQSPHVWSAPSAPPAQAHATVVADWDLRKKFRVACLKKTRMGSVC